MKKIMIALALTATTALMAHDSMNYHNELSVHTVCHQAPQKVVYTQTRIVRVEPARVYYAWNDRRYERGYERRFERREDRREERREDRYNRHEWHDHR
ncbi:hypothetical protein [Sulfuricurvum sp.]|uniref:hypothetical protein n=1 Tax=Sulfuricurvum sp. TaxID=2025608 RepID=UPI002D4FC264|nr:hypothetical protein [Sulfuricurvum sp.]HZF70136.1 hypothetical protein [Sulfuricurvum sp.]